MMTSCARVATHTAASPAAMEALAHSSACIGVARPLSGSRARRGASGRAAAPARRTQLAVTARSGGRPGGYNNAPPPPPDVSNIQLAGKSAVAPPAGCKWYETTMLLRPDATEAERAAELAKISSFLTAQGATALEVAAREPTPTAYPVQGHSHAAYVQLTFAATTAAVSALHKLFSTPVVGAEPVLMRYMTFAKK